MTSTATGQPSVGDLAEVAASILSLVGGEVEARVVVTREHAALTRFANSFIHQNVADDTLTADLDVCVGGKSAGASTNRTDTDGLRRLVDRAVAAARLRRVDPQWPGLASPQQPPAVEHYDTATARAEPERRAQVVEAFVAAGDGLTSAGYCETVGIDVAFANSAGQALTGRASRAVLDGIQRQGGADGVGVQTSVSIADLDGAATGHLAAAKARAAATDPVELPPGHYEVVLEPRCVSDILAGLSWYGFNARAVAEGQSFARIGEAQFDPAISVWDDATDARAVGLVFDHEGTPKRRVPLVTDGTVVGLAHDRRTALAMGAESTGHAVAGGETIGAFPLNVFLGAGPSSPEELIAGVERGLLVSDFWYTRVLDPKTLVMTGLTRNGVFLIEDGHVGRAVGNLRFTQSYVGALAPGKVGGVGSDARLVSTIDYVFHTPTLRLASWNFTGNARG
jgi:predicted Zn-dependent protease